MDHVEEAIAAAEAAEAKAFRLTIGSTGRVIALPTDLTPVELVELAMWFTQQVAGAVAKAYPAPDRQGGVVLATPAGPVRVGARGDA